MQAKEEWPITLGELIDRINRAVAEPIRQVAVARDRFVALPQIVLPARVPVRMVIGNAAADAEEAVIPTFQRAEPRRHTERCHLPTSAVA